MKEKDRINYKLVILLIAVIIISSCVTTKQNFEQVKRIDAIGSYETFLKEHPNSEYTSWIYSRIEELTKQHDERVKQLAEMKHKLDIEREKRLAEKNSKHQLRSSKLKNYNDEILTEDQFLADGWNVSDPYHSQLGIVGYQCFDLSDSCVLTKEYSTNIIGDRRGRYSIYWLGVDSSLQIIEGIGLESSSMRDHLIKGGEWFLKSKGITYMKPSNYAQLGCKLTFIDGKLAEIKQVD